MAHWCDSCGQQLPEGSEPSNATWLGKPDDTHEHTFERPAGAKKEGSDKRLLVAVVAIVGLWFAFVGIGQIITPDKGVDDRVAADMEADRIDQEVERALDEAATEREAAAAEAAEIAAAQAEMTAAEAAADGEAIIAIDAPRRVGSLQVERLQRQLVRRSSAAYVAYLSDVGVVVVDLVTGEATVSVAGDIVPTVKPGNQVLRSGAASYSIDPETLDISLVGQGSSIVIGDAADGNTYFVDAAALSGQASVIEVVADGAYTFHRMPAVGSQLLAVDGLGLLVVPKGAEGETLIAGAESFTTLRPNRVLTGTSQAVLEQVCVNEGNCSLALTDLASGDQTAVPTSFVRFGDHYALAPNGRLLLRYSPEGFAEVFVADIDSIAWVVGAGLNIPAWGPNSNFIAWLDLIGDPTLKVMFTDERDWLTIDLRDFGAPPPVGPEIIVFTGPTLDAETAIGTD